MTRAFMFVAVLLAAAPPAFAQPTPIEPPVVDRPADFSNIVGKYDIKVTAEPTDVQVEDAITLRIEIIGAGPEKYEPNRKRLRPSPSRTPPTDLPALFPESWQNDFYVQELQDKHEVLRDKKTWLFVYRLKPKHTRIEAINDIKLIYYDPDLRDEKKFVTKYARRIDIKVRPKPDKSDEKELDLSAAPDSFFHFASSSDLLIRPPTAPAIAGWQVVLFLAMPPLLCLVGAFAFRRLFPDELQRARQYRDTSAARAQAQLQAGVSAWDVVCHYLHERFDFPVEDAAPAEVAAFLKRRGFATALGEQSRAFLHACDAARFTGSTAVESKALAQQAARLIQALEADPCARG